MQEAVINNNHAAYTPELHIDKRRKFKSPEDMEKAIEAYFEENRDAVLNKQGEPTGNYEGHYSLPGLAYALGYSRTDHMYRAAESGDIYGELIARARLRIEAWLAGWPLMTRDGGYGAAKQLACGFGWKEEQSAAPSALLTGDDALKLIGGIVKLLETMQQKPRELPAITITDAPYEEK